VYVHSRARECWSATPVISLSSRCTGTSVTARTWLGQGSAFPLSGMVQDEATRKGVSSLGNRWLGVGGLLRQLSRCGRRGGEEEREGPRQTDSSKDVRAGRICANDNLGQPPQSTLRSTNPKASASVHRRTHHMQRYFSSPLPTLSISQDKRRRQLKYGWRLFLSSSAVQQLVRRERQRTNLNEEIVDVGVGLSRSLEEHNTV
jgi:hypothetical protein